MINQEKFAYYLTIIIAIIIATIALSGVVSFGEYLLSGTQGLVIFGLILIYVMAMVSAKKNSNIHWTGFMRLALLVTWLIFDIQAACFVACFGSLSAFLLHRLDFSHRVFSDFKAAIEYFANSAGSVIATFALYTLFNGATPPLVATGQYSSLAIIIIAILGGTVVSVILLSITRHISVERLVIDSRKYIMPEILIIIGSLTLPFIYGQINNFVFLVILASVAIQIYRYEQINRSELQLKQRIQEMETLNKLGSAVASQLSIVGSLELVYQELNHLLDATTIYIALFDEDRGTLKYPYVVVNGNRITREEHELGYGLAEYVIREKRAIRYTREDVRRVLKNLYDTKHLSDEQYMIAPLQVSTKIIGLLGVSHAHNAKAFSEHDFALFQTLTSQASLAIRNATLYDRTVRLADDLSIINQSVQDVMFNLDRAEALNKACQIAIGVTRASKAAIFLLAPMHGNQLQLVESVGFEDLDFVEHITFDPTRFKAGAYVINNIANSHQDEIIEQAQQGQFNACAEIPLRSGNVIVGSLSVYHDLAHYYDPPELNLLEMLANQITAALDNADLLQALELYAAEQSQLVHLSRISGDTLELERIIHDVCVMLKEILAVSRAQIAVLNAEKSHLLFQSSAYSSIDFEMEIERVPEISKLFLDASSMQIFHDSESYSEGLVKYMANYSDATLAVIPMQLQTETIGLIILGNSELHQFNENDLRLLEMATHQITAQIHNAQVHTHTQAQLAERLEQLTLIEDIAQQISEALEFDIIIQNVLESALQSTNADFASIALIDNDKVATFDVIWREVVADRLVPNRITLHMSDGVVGHVIKTSEMLIVPDNREFADYFVPVETTREFRSSLAVPMLTRNRVVGVLNLESSKVDFFTMEQASFIKNLAGHAAISIESTNLLGEIQHSNDRMRAILDSTRDGIILLDNHNRIQDANSAASGLTSINLQNYLFEPLARLSTLDSHSQDVKQTWQHIIDAYGESPENIHNQEYTFVSEEHIVDVKLMVNRVLDATQNTIGWLLILRDITEAKKLQDFRETMQSMVLHDLRGPLTAIVTSMYVAENILVLYDDDFEELKSLLTKTFEVSLSSAEDMLRQVDTLRDLPMMNQMQVEPYQLSMLDIVTTAYSSLSANFLDAKIDVEIDIAASEQVFVDESLIRRVIVNLLHNAFKFTPLGGKVLIRLCHENDDANYVSIQIADTGPGIPVEQRERIFGQFIQVEGQKPRTGGKGTGLGLNFCKLAVEAHEGRIWAEANSPLSGACFSFTIPIVDWRDSLDSTDNNSIMMQ